MNPQFPLSLALTDFIPNLFFLMGAILLYRRMYPSHLFALGVALVFLNAMAKAAWKVILSLGGPDVAWLSENYLVLLSLGFLAIFIAVLRQDGQKKSLPLLALAVWKVPFLLVAVVSSIGAYIVWIRTAWQKRIWLAAASFALSLVITLVMSALTGDEYDLTQQWTAQTLNMINQGCFALGAYFLSRR